MDVRRGFRGASTPGLLFYICLAAGCALFGGLKAAAVLVLLILACNRILGLAGGALGSNGSPARSLTIRSLLSLGLFPFVWLACRGLPGGWLLPAIGVILSVGVGLSWRQKTMKGEPARADSAGILFILLLVTVATRLPFSKIGSPVDGQLAYRAYFSSDYLKHFSVVESLNNGSMPPGNPYFAGETLHYYWLPYAVPAVVSRLTGSTAKALFAYSFAVNFLFLLLMFQACQRISHKRRWMPFLAVPLVLAPSLEGAYLWASRMRFSFAALFADGRAFNIDGLTRWLWNLPQIDTLLRSLLYTPQHLLSLAFVLLFLIYADEGPERPWLLSLFLALSLASSFFVGGILLVSRSLHILGREGTRLVRRDLAPAAFFRGLAGHFFLPALVLGLSVLLRMISSGGSEVVFKPLGPRQIFLLLGLNLGLLVVSGVWGLLAARFRSRVFVAVLLGVSVSLLLAIRIAGFESDVSLKAGLVTILVLALLTCRLGEISGAGKFAAALALLILLPGSLTAILDVRNSADVRNARFTSYISVEEMRMLEWVRENTPLESVVQNFPPARAWNLSALPAFSGRRMAVGDRMHGQIFQVRPDAYERRLEALRLAIGGLPGTRDALRRLGVDYLFWGEDESRFFKIDPVALPVAHKEGGTVLYAIGPDQGGSRRR